MLAKTPIQAKQHSLITVTLHSFFKLSSSALISLLEVKLFIGNTDFGMLLWTRVKFHYQQLDCQHKFFLDWSLPIVYVSSWEELIINCKNLLCDDFLNSHDLNLSSHFYLRKRNELIKTQHGNKRTKTDHLFKVLSKCNGKFDYLIYEMFYIKDIKPSLNVQSDSICAKLFM